MNSTCYMIEVPKKSHNRGIPIFVFKLHWTHRVFNTLYVQMYKRRGVLEGCRLRVW